MTTSWKTLLTGAALVAATIATTIATAGPAAAQFPERRIQNIYPWSPGTPTYAVSQIIADAMGDELGVQIPVVARPGAGGVNAFMAALAEPADGYTIIDGYVAPLVISPLFGRAEFTYEDFIPLYSATSNAFAVISRPDEDRWTDFPSFIEYIKEHPGETRYGAGTLSLPHLVAARMLQNSDAVARHVPYNDLADGLVDMRGGLLDWMIANPGMYNANKQHMRVLAVLSEQPEVSEMYDGAPRVMDFGIDLGLTGLAPIGWNWWVVREGTPDEAVERLRDAMEAALARPEVRERILDIGFVPTGYGPEEYEEVVGSVRDQLQTAIGAVAWEREQLEQLD